MMRGNLYPNKFLARGEGVKCCATERGCWFEKQETQRLWELQWGTKLRAGKNGYDLHPPPGTVSAALGRIPEENQAWPTTEHQPYRRWCLIKIIQGCKRNAVA